MEHSVEFMEAPIAAAYSSAAPSAQFYFMVSYGKFFGDPPKSYQYPKSYHISDVLKAY